MAAYTTLTKNSIDKILEHYGLSDASEFSILLGGSENTNYFIENNEGKFVLTICERKSKKETQSLADLLEHLAKHDFESSRIIRNKEGNALSWFENKPVLLKVFLDGKVLDTFDENLLEALGRQIAHLHEIPAPEYLPDRFDYGVESFPDFIADYPDSDFSKWLGKIADLVNESTTGLPKALIHGDIFCNNVIVMENDFPVIMDFEEACCYYKIFDLGMAVAGTCCDGTTILTGKVNALLKGYESVLPLLESETEKFPVFIACAAASTALWRYRQYRILNPDENSKDKYLEMKGIADFALGDFPGMFFN